MSIVENYLKIKNSIPKEVKLVIVTKNQTSNDIRTLLKLGHTYFAENKVQEAESKWPILKQDFPNVKLHMIGHLQSNKVKKALKLFDVIESVDRPSLINAISLHEHQSTEFFLQINIGEEIQKHGVKIVNIKEIIDICNNSALNVSGLMCIPPNSETPELYFQKMLNLQIKFAYQNLSMGMSNDYLKAIKYGATQIRVGRAIFNNLSS